MPTKVISVSYQLGWVRDVELVVLEKISIGIGKIAKKIFHACCGRALSDSLRVCMVPRGWENFPSLWTSLLPLDGEDPGSKPVDIFSSPLSALTALFFFLGLHKYINQFIIWVCEYMLYTIHTHTLMFT